MANLSVNICGVTLKNPVIAASGTFGFGREFNELYDIGTIGGGSDVRIICDGCGRDLTLSREALEKNIKKVITTEK